MHYAGSFLLLVLFAASPASAQWLHVSLPHTPRGLDGKPNLTAPVPRSADGKPDLSGVWRGAENALNSIDGRPRNSHRLNIAVDVAGGAPLTPWAKELLDARRNAQGRGIPTQSCLPFGLPAGMLSTNLPIKIIQTREVTVMLFEEFNDWRQIHTDGRELPVDPEPAWFGYSVGRWDGDSFVVDTIGMNEKTWLDGLGTPHSDALRLTERYKRIDFGHMRVEFTFDDPKAFTKSWTATVELQLIPDTDVMDHHCENEKDAVRLR